MEKSDKDRWRVAPVDHLQPPPDTPPGSSYVEDGRSPDLRVVACLRLPALSGAVVIAGSLAAYSCGGSHGFGG